MVRVKNARSLLKDDATLSGILHYSGLRPVAALYFFNKIIPTEPRP